MVELFGSPVKKVALPCNPKQLTAPFKIETFGVEQPSKGKLLPKPVHPSEKDKDASTPVPKQASKSRGKRRQSEVTVSSSEYNAKPFESGPLETPQPHRKTEESDTSSGFAATSAQTQINTAKRRFTPSPTSSAFLESPSFSSSSSAINAKASSPIYEKISDDEGKDDYNEDEGHDVDDEGDDDDDDEDFDIEDEEDDENYGAKSNAKKRSRKGKAKKAGGAKEKTTNKKLNKSYSIAKTGRTTE